MSVWNQLENLMREAGPEKKAAGKAGAAPEKFEKDIEGDDIDTIIDSTASERDRSSLNLTQWSQKIEQWLNGLRKVRKDANEVIARFRNMEEKIAKAEGTSQMSPEELREHEWHYGGTWDNYIIYILRKAGHDGLANGLRGKLKAQILQRKATPEKQSNLPGADLTKSFTSKADVQRETPEFKSFEEWLEKAFPTMYPGNVPEPQAWDETMHWFASVGDAELPNWVAMYKAWKDNGSDRVFRVFKKLYDQNFKQIMDRKQSEPAAQWYAPGADPKDPRNRMIADPQDPNAPPVDTGKVTALQNVFKQKGTGDQSDPDRYKKQFRQTPDDREKRKFPTWWDYGFKGNIPFSDM